ncbi:MAG: CHAT domain-containing protein [Candidatus Lokiarchaeota archaeon]|nr:CHAT domain-containing protein [Candidatus Lokiarchaeota archaeon]
MIIPNHNKINKKNNRKRWVKIYNLKYKDRKIEDLNIEDLERVFELATEFNMREDEERSLNAIGLRLHRAGKYEEALKNYEHALKISEEIGDIAGRGMILNNIGYIKWAQNDFEAAKVYFEDSIDIYEQFIGEIQTAVEKIDITEELNPYYGIIELLFDIYKESNEKETLYEALKYIELAKSINIIDKLQVSQIIEKYPKENIELIKEEKGLINDMFFVKQEINDLNKRKREIWGLLQKYRRFEDQETIKDTISNLQNEINDLKSRINEKNDFLLELGKKSRTLRIEIMEKLEDPGLIKSTKEFNPYNDIMSLFEIENIVIWELFYIPDTVRYENKFNVLVLEKDNIELYQVNGFNADEFKDSYKIFRKMMSDPVLKYHSFEKLTDIKNVMSEILPKELLNTIENKTKLILIPHSLLHLIPWEIIEPIALKIPMCRNFSLRILNACINKDISGQGLFFVNNPTFNSFPLQVIENEINNIKKLLDDYRIKYEIMTHEDATKEKFLNKIKNETNDVIHFGGYANFDPLDKIKSLKKGESIIEGCDISGLLFYNEEEYSILRLNELINTGFKSSPLLILNEFNYDIGENSELNCLVVFIRGMILAGVAGLLIPNWEIMEEITPEFMLEFYHNLSSDLDVCESLFESRKKIWVDNKRPVLYGAYALYGNPFKKVNLE